MASPTPTGNGSGRYDNRRTQVSVITVTMVLGAALLVLALLVLWLGDPDAGEPRLVLKVLPQARIPSEVFSQTPPPGGPSSSAALIAADGTVITDPALTEETGDGPIPIIAADGRRPMDLYGRPFDRTDPRPRIAVIVAGLGIGEAITQAAIDKLPPPVTLSFTPYGTNLQSSVSAARAAGHEVLLELPMEPFDYPSNDPGPHTLMTGSSAAENPAHLQWLMSRISGYAGVMNMQGAKFLSVPEDLRPIVEQVKRRGLFVLDNGAADRSVLPEIANTAQAPFARADSILDRVPSREGVDLELKNLEIAAKTNGSAIGIATANPMTIDRITAWASDLEQRGIALAPVTAVIAAETGAQAPPLLPPQPTRGEATPALPPSLD
jgi:polysaccharide deacetylase 2 family uncharacterized protein YibQ